MKKARACTRAFAASSKRGAIRVHSATAIGIATQSGRFAPFPLLYPRHIQAEKPRSAFLGVQPLLGSADRLKTRL